MTGYKILSWLVITAAVVWPIVLAAVIVLAVRFHKAVKALRLMDDTLAGKILQWMSLPWNVNCSHSTHPFIAEEQSDEMSDMSE